MASVLDCCLIAPLTTGHSFTPNHVTSVTSEPTIFGMPAIPVTQPDGETALYLIVPQPVTAGWMAGKWNITSADGKTYTVTESKGRHWWCGCKSFEFAKRSCKRTLPTGQLVCKHIGSLFDRKYAPAEVGV